MPIKELAHLLDNIPAARLFEEYLKLFMYGKAEANLLALQEFGLFGFLFPQAKTGLKNPQGFEYKMQYQLCVDTDARINSGKRVTPAYLFAATLWYPVLARAEQLSVEGGLPEYDAMQIAAADVLAKQSRNIAIPKRFSLPARDIWTLQIRLQQTSPRRAERLLTHPKFRAGYDFLLLRESAGEQTDDLGDWWTRYQDANDSERRAMIRDLSSKDQPGSAPRKRRRSGGRRKRGPSEGSAAE